MTGEQQNIYTTMDTAVGQLVLAGDGVKLDTITLWTTPNLWTTLSQPTPKSITPSLPAGTMDVGTPPGEGGGCARGIFEAEAYGEVVAQLRAYFAGEPLRFEVAHTERGTEFQRRVWAAIDEIPYGTTISYGRLAERVGAPRDRIRAVAAAVGANPLLIVRPCHRVIGANGALTGYAGGVPAKQALLVHEGALQPQLV